MVLRLIETNDAPKNKDLVKNFNRLLYLKTQDDVDNIGESWVVALPYGVSNEEIRPEQLVKGTKVLSLVDDESYGEVFEVDTDVIGWEHTFAGDTESRIIHILPEHFDLDEVANLGLKDGDEFDFKYADHITDAVAITSRPYIDEADIVGEIHKLFKQLPESPLQRFMALWFTYNEKDIPKQMYTESDMMESYYAGVDAGKWVEGSMSFPEFIKKLR
jgi:hypothetical protein